MAESAPERPSFVPYEKMTLSTKVWASQRLDGIKQWVAMEKIHGANFSFTVACQSVASSSRHSDTSTDKAGASATSKLPHDRPLSVYVARRGDYLREDEYFYGVTSQREFLELQKEKARCVCTSIIQRMDHTGSEEITSITIVGELFGGYYPHPSVEVCRGVSNVQKEVVYCPDIKFCAFDIAISTSNEQVSRRYLDYDVCIELFKESGFLYAEPLAIGTLQDMISYPLGFESKLPAKFGLPTLDKPNVAEGIVIKPLKNAVLDTNKGPKRVIFKRKVEGFAEVKPRGRGGRQKKQRVPTANSINGQDYELLKYEMLALVTPQRVTNVMSKIGRPSEKASASEQSQLHGSAASNKSSKKEAHSRGGVEWKDIVRDLVKDVIEDTELEHEELWMACQMDGKRMGQVMKEIKEECIQCVEEYKRNNVD